MSENISVDNADEMATLDKQTDDDGQVLDSLYEQAAEPANKGDAVKGYDSTPTVKPTHLTRVDAGTYTLSNSFGAVQVLRGYGERVALTVIADGEVLISDVSDLTMSPAFALKLTGNEGPVDFSPHNGPLFARAITGVVVLTVWAVSK